MRYVTYISSKSDVLPSIQAIRLLFRALPLFYKQHKEFRTEFITPTFLLHVLSVQQNSIGILIFNLWGITSSSSTAVLMTTL
jgi:hypothetical protein